MLKRLRPVLTFHWLTTLLLMGVFALGLGLASLNLIATFSANLNLIAEHGSMALLDGATHQLFELIGYGYLSVILYVLFKTCERVLVDQVLQPN